MADPSPEAPFDDIRHLIAELPGPDEAAAAAVSVNVLPLQGQQLADTATGRERSNNQSSQMRRGHCNESFLFAWLQSPGADCFSCAVEADDVDAVTLEGSVVSISLRE